MEIKIGVQGVARELVVDVEMSADDLQSAITAAISEPGNLFDLTDSRGRRLLVPGSKLAFVEIGEPEVRRVGFGVS